MKNYRFKAKVNIGQWLAIFALSFALAGPTLAAAPYYEGKTIEVIIPFGVAGGSDVWIRTIAPYLEKILPAVPNLPFATSPAGEPSPA